MRVDADQLLLSATDLANHLACRHLSELDHELARGRLDEPDRHDPALALLRERGLRHERAYVESLRAEGRQIVELGDAQGDPAFERTLAAAHDGAEVIVQAALRDDRWVGYADLLMRVESSSALGDWSYEVVDTKLAQQTRGGTVLQLCLYADLLHPIQGRPAECMHVVKPGDGFPRETFRFDEHAAYYRLVRRRLEAFVDGRAGTEGTGATIYPEPVPHCDVCRWWARCDARRHRDDHLCLVAGMSALHSTELRRQGLGTLEAFAGADEPLPEAPQRGHREAYAGLQAQAAVQLRGRDEGKPVVELLPPEPGRGFGRLPEPSPGDVFLDFEGDPFVDDGGLEYLLGWACSEGGAELRYTALWATDRGAEKHAFESFLDVVMARLERHPGLHVYHFAPYEPAALKRLASRHATRERELDVLLRGERFVDLHGVTRQGLLASVESYSLKPLETFFGYEREVELREEAGPALRRVAWALELDVPDEITDADRRLVEGYNRDDCLSLVMLRGWLEERRAELVATGARVERPPPKDGAASEAAEERSEEIQALYDRLVEGVPVDPGQRSPEQAGRWLLAHMLEYFRREDRVAWWEYFARRDAEREDLLKDRKALLDLDFVQDLGVQRQARLPTHRYRFPPQEASFDEGDEVRDLEAPKDGPRTLGTVQAFDLQRGLIDIKKTGQTVDLHPRAIHVHDHVPPRPVDHSLFEEARWVAEHGIDAADGHLRAARDLLLRRPPRTAALPGPSSAPSAPVDAALRIAGALEGGVLAIQGPPGSGKSTDGARMILALARAGQRVGVSATSHKVIRNLLEKVLEAAREAGADLRVAHKPSSRRVRPPPPLQGLVEVSAAGQALEALADGLVVGGVAWLWGADAMQGCLDTLFIDEAGQMSLAHVLASSRAARNLVLLGDPQQLQQPQRGAHPEGAEISALNHLLGGHKTMPEALGLFLAQTWRLPPAICAYTSEAFYESRLHPRPGCERQVLTGSTPFAGAGLFYVPCLHEGNQSSSGEEVEAVAWAVESLMAPGVRWTDAAGREHELRREDILVVAPYNAQVAALARGLPALDIGTVDRFQGQQRPVVIYSMTSSSAQDAPRGMAFLYDLHRLNVATSRAQCACILVASPALFEPECRMPEQIRWASALCRYKELATVVDVEA